MEPGNVELSNRQALNLKTRRQSIRDNNLADEAQLIDTLLPLAELADGPDAPRQIADATARQLVSVIRHRQVRKLGIDTLLNEYPLASEEGLALMRLAEALLRVPDNITSDALIVGLLGSGDWRAHRGGGHSWFANTLSLALPVLVWLAQRNTQGQSSSPRLNESKSHTAPPPGWQRLLGAAGQPAARAVLRVAVARLGDQFVLAGDIHRALDRSRKLEARGYRYSYDMLGEGARTAADADRYHRQYLAAIDAVGEAVQPRAPEARPSVSVKLSALHPRYHFLQRQRVMAELVPRLEQLALAARARGIDLTVDAEEAQRLELSLDVIEAVFCAEGLTGWDGFGLAVQAYQKRALPVIEWCHNLARERGQRLAVRLVKGAYWDTEIKLAQLQGLDNYPVFTRKLATDVSYRACARRLLGCRDWLYPQFATHNAATVAAIVAMDDNHAGFEFQRLYGMGEVLHEEVRERTGIPCRIYGPVGERADLLSYLVRRLLENGANTSFVSQVLDTDITPEALAADPVAQLCAAAPSSAPVLPLPRDIYGPARRNARGYDLSDPAVLARLQQQLVICRDQVITGAGSDPGRVTVHNPANLDDQVGSHPPYASREDMESALHAASEALPHWSRRPVAERAALVERFADTLENHGDELIALCVREAGRTLSDSLAEVREAVDFCRYYAAQARLLMADGQCRPRGVLLCISPWNFPLAIFVGQLVAALVTGNTAVAKPAEQTSLLALRALELLHQCGLPPGVVALLISPGKPVGEALVPDPRVRGVLFTGSSATARWLNRSLARRLDSPLPLVAETGGQNAMIVDATCLPEQVVDDVIRSGFNSAGQRCSSLRVLFLQAEIAPRVIDMLKGAMAELAIGDPALPCTDVGPVIDDLALMRLHDHVDYMTGRGELLYACELPRHCDKGHFFAPRLYEIKTMAVLTGEVFGPVVHVIRYRSDNIDQVIAQIHASGYGLTFGIHSRNPVFADQLARRIQAGNIYINRDMVGAVVGVQPFGGRGLSGTGPKGGGPHYLPALVDWQTDMHNVTLGPVTLSAPTKGASSDAPQLPTADQIDALYQAGLRWRETAVAERLTVLGGVLDALREENVGAEKSREPTGQKGGATSGPQWLVSSSWHTSVAATLEIVKKHMEDGIALPGPTGESNHLLLESRGLTVCLLSDVKETGHWLASILISLAAGNPVLMIATLSTWPQANVCQQLLTTSQLPAAIWHMAITDDPENLTAIITHPHIAAATLAATSPWCNAVTKLLATGSGAITPLICDPPGKPLLLRLTTEKTITVNTAAAGGDAALLTSAVTFNALRHVSRR